MSSIVGLHQPWVYRTVAAITLLLAPPLCLTACKPWTVRPIDPESKRTAEPPQESNPSAYVASVWESKVVPTVINQAVELTTLLAALDTDPEAAKRQYGRREADGPYQFIVKGEGRISRVNSSSRSRTVAINLPKYQGKREVLIQVGPVIRGTSLRDAVGFINFDQFVNQLQYAEVANGLNDRVLTSVLNDLDLNAAQGRQVSFYGVFTLGEGNKVFITPVRLGWEGKG